MLSKKYFATFLLLSGLLLVTPASARQWSPDAKAAALDYTQILHSKGGGSEIVFLWWVVPETFPASPNSQPVLDALSRYVILGIAHGHSNPGAPMSFDNIADLRIADSTSRSISALGTNLIPPEAAQALGSVRTLAQQSLGPIGQGMRWFVFDGSTIHSCAAGKMSVPFAGETYTYDTPIPGCGK
jgi:hypothetical protein